jgi:hypothetical protein
MSSLTKTILYSLPSKITRESLVKLGNEPQYLLTKVIDELGAFSVELLPLRENVDATLNQTFSIVFDGS